jgi:CspA family cold shock protein
MSSGTVKFFNGAKGFGFIAPSDGGADVFVHASALERSGVHVLNEGDEVEFEVGQDRRTGKLEVTDLQVTAAAPPGAQSSRPDRGPRPAFGGGGRDSGPRGGPGGGGQRFQRDAVGSGSGVVKWFNDAKGFGFIQPDGGGADVFVHVSAVERSGLGRLDEGQQVAYDLEQDPRTGKTSAANLRAGR